MNKNEIISKMFDNARRTPIFISYRTVVKNGYTNKDTKTNAKDKTTTK